MEPGIENEITDALRDRGHTLKEAPLLGRVNAIYCPDGLSKGQESCAFISDRRGFGLALGNKF